MPHITGGTNILITTTLAISNASSSAFPKYTACSCHSLTSTELAHGTISILLHSCYMEGWYPVSIPKNPTEPRPGPTLETLVLNPPTVKASDLKCA